MRASIIISFHDYPTQVIVGSASYIAEDPHPPLHEIYRNNESVSPNPRNPLENYTLYSVDMVDGVLCDTIKFKTDKIFLSHNQVKALADLPESLYAIMNLLESRSSAFLFMYPTLV